jgi:hypothetical protein
MAATPERSVAHGGDWETYVKLPHVSGAHRPCAPFSSCSVFGIKLRKSDGGPFFDKFVQTHAPSAREGLEPLMFGIR